MANSLTLEHCKSIIEGAFRKAIELNTPPLTIAVLDSGGVLKAFERQDNSSIFRPEIAIAKAKGAIGMGMSSRELGMVASERPAFINSLTTMSNGQLVPVPGGVLIRNAHEEIIGSVGVSGDTSDNDELCALAGIHNTVFTN